VPKPMCRAEGCHRRSRVRGACRIHYAGRPCVVTDCLNTVEAHGYCNKHYRRFQAHGDPTVVSKAIQGHGDENTAWRGDNIRYRAAHVRVRVTRGRAADHQCMHCDDQAAHWAYDHADPAEKLHSYRVGSRALPFSLDPMHYLPLCRPCHKKFDAQSIRRCSVEGCERQHEARSWCRTHYRRWQQTGEVGSAVIRSRRRGK